MRPMTSDREYRAKHIAGHAYAAIISGFAVHRLSIDGFSESDVEDRGNAQRIDPWTMLHIPTCAGGVGSYQHTLLMEHLMNIALAGPVVELSYRNIPCVLENVRQFRDDFAQAWNAAGFCCGEDTERLRYLERRICNSPAVVCYGVGGFHDKISNKLLECGTANGEDVQLAWDEMKAAYERSSSPPVRRSKFPHIDWRDDGSLI